MKVLRKVLFFQVLFIILFNFLYLELILKWSLRAYTCVHVRASACVCACVRACACVHACGRACTTKKNFWPKKNFFEQRIYFTKKKKQKCFWPKKFFSPIFIFYTKLFFLPKKTKQKHHLCWNIDLTLITWIRFLPSMYSLMSYKTILYGKTLYHIDYMWMDSSQCVLSDNL